MEGVWVTSEVWEMVESSEVVEVWASVEAELSEAEGVCEGV